MWDSAVLTNSGLNLMVQWVDGAVLTIDKATVGEGTVNEAYLMGQTQLVAEKKQLSIVRQDRVANGVRIQMQCTNEGVTEAFTINQIGVWAHLNDGASVLLSIYQDDTGVLVPTNAEMPEYVFTFYAVLQVSNTGTLEVTIDASAVVTKAQLDEATSAIDAEIKKIVDGTTEVGHATNAAHATSADTATNAGHATSADTATKATQDANGNIISDTYATKAEVGESGLIAITTALNENIPDEMLKDIVANPQNYVVISSSASNTPGFYIGRSGDTLMYRNNNLAFSGGQTVGIGFNIDATTGRLTNTAFTLVSKAGDGYGTVNPTSKTEEMTEPIGVDQSGGLWAAGGKVNLNGQDNNNPAFYAPIESGTDGQILVSRGAGQAPVWKNKTTDIGPAVVTWGAFPIYNGGVQSPTIESVTLYGVPLQKDVDYVISGGNTGQDAGQYSMLISGKGNYRGMFASTWEIERAASSVSVNVPSMNLVGLGPSSSATITYTGDGTLSVSSSDSSIAQCSISGATVTVTGVKTGTATIYVNLSQGKNYTESSCTIAVNVVVPLATFNDNSWAAIRAVSDAGLGESVWSVGDTKEIVLNGTVGGTVIDNKSLLVYIIGFNHNSSTEGSNRIHIQGFKTMDGKSCALDLAGAMSGSSSSIATYPNINHWGAVNYGGWAACDARYDLLGSTDAPPNNYGSKKSAGATGNNPTSTCATNPVEKSLMAAFPEDLRAVMKSATKYTDNVGGGRASVSNISPTIDYLWFLSEYEIFGNTYTSNSSESSYQMQYEYYSNGNETEKAPCLGNAGGYSSIIWWTRSPSYVNSSLDSFCTEDQGSHGYRQANRGYCFAPAFAV